MEDNSLLKLINQEVEDYKTKTVQIVPGLSYNQWAILQRIIHYYNSKFSGQGSSLDPIDDDGDRMYFLNINKNPCKVYSKAIDFDTKNIRLLTTGGGDPLKTWFMERDLKYWMRDKQFGKILNRLFTEIPIYGTVVLKIINGTPYFVDLRNFVVEQTAENLDSTNYIIEVHNFTVGQFRKRAKEMSWEQSKVDETIDLFHKMKDASHIRVYERYGEVPQLQDDGSSKYSYRRVFFADVGVDQYDERTGDLVIEKKGVELSSEEWEGHPYREFHAEKMPGRWLGVGVVETLFEPQIRLNQIANLQSKASYWMALHVFQTRDPNFNRNISNEAKNGEVLNVESEVAEVVITDRNLAHFTDEKQTWLSNRDEQTFSYDVVQGERLPAGTPLGSAQIAQTQTLSYFEQIQENIALEVKEMIYVDVIPTFQKENSHEHTLRLVGKDLDEFAQMVKNDMVAKEIIRQAINSGKGKPFPTEKDKEIIEIAVSEAIKQGKERILTIEKNFYKDVKYDVDIDITGESVDTRVRAATKFAILQAITADPTMLTDPTKKKILASYMEDGGINPNDFFGVEEKRIEDMVPMQGAGGGVSAPNLGPKIQGQVQQTV